MSFLNGLKIYFIASLIPFLIKKRKELSSLDMKRIITVIKEAAIQCIRGALFVSLGNSVPFAVLCYYPFDSPMIRNLSIRKKVPLLFTSVASLCLIVENPSKMPVQELCK